MRLHHNLKPHPLESVARLAYRNHPAHDRITLGCFLKGCSGFRGKRSASGDKAYLIVAEDVLGSMQDQGKLVVDEYGWHRLPDPKCPSPKPYKDMSDAELGIIHASDCVLR